MSKFVIAFDVYGTLLDTSSISGALSETLHLDKNKAEATSALWRRYQLEYTWRLNSMKLYQSFDIITEKSLRHALKESGISFDDPVIKKLMEAYNILPCFPDTASSVQQLQRSDNMKIVIFTNGTHEMASKALDAAGLSHFALDVYTVENHKRYKPDPEVNAFDVTGSLSTGMRAIYVDRSRNGWKDELLPLETPGALEPMKIVHGLEEIPGLLASLE
ncbi:haloacid dehalogenase [Sanghuangporus baumii]|uniref:Haloacid dehalogenase n=1 Tax=Sanghuangporus baumii TaxID=108892 RepID=A0A9Q5I4A7_SANBA|nr:haloacid dehalogenase [Sanghuangporus baumii]